MLIKLGAKFSLDLKNTTLYLDLRVLKNLWLNILYVQLVMLFYTFLETKLKTKGLFTHFLDCVEEEQK